MAEESPEGKPGLFSSLRRLAQLSLQTLHTRIELFSVELREETGRALQALILVSAFIFLASVGLLLVSFTIIFTVWEDPQERIAALWGLSSLYLLGAAIAGALGWRKLKSDRLPFANTLREFEKDKEWVRGTDTGPGRKEQE